MRMRRNDIEYFINPGWRSSSGREGILALLLTIFIVGIPTAIFGALAKVTSLVMIPIIIAFSIWTILLLTNLVNQNQVNLFCGTSALFLSLSSLLVAYKYSISCGQQVSFKTVFLVLSLYFICIGVNLAMTIRSIHKGYYKQDKKQKNVGYLSSLVTVIIVVFGRRFLGLFNETFIEHLVLVFCVIMAFLLALGTTNIIRYYLDITIKD